MESKVLVPSFVEKNKVNIGVLYSGGLDSSALICHLLSHGHTVWPVYVQSSLSWEKTELYWAQRFLKSIRSKKLKPLIKVRLLLENAYEKNWSRTGKTPGANSSDRDVFLPARNLLLITKALLVLTSKDVWALALGTLKGNPFPDATPNYFFQVEKLLGQSFRHPIKILTPFRDKTKKAVMQENRDCPFHLSFSCINPKEIRHCGKCNKCAERQRAFKELGLVQPKS